METRRWTNPTQPQTLQIAVFLLYINAVFSALAFNPIAFALALGQGAAAFGIANEKRWGYVLGIVAATFGLLPFALYLLNSGVGSIFNLSLLISLVFPVALFALLIHPQSREYQRIWFS
ncbi:MAG: hypothetical protein F2520_05480 [Actinobacteria bacterium]|uniref:Unannotated protein n=1 Tax=freshwater metagenome TaxID=449393 RepID=A0A6J7IE18_9ZZZZ|nr:hypothetical protein [Actinomycetota bacterium]MTA77692.1 hypothetical protein [Actinomycetota bacterium]